MAKQSPRPESRIAPETSDVNPEQAAQNYLELASGETDLECAKNAAQKARHDAEETRKKLHEVRELNRRASLAADVLDGVKRRAADDAADAVLDDEANEAGAKGGER